METEFFQYTVWVPVLVFLSFLVVGLFGNKMSNSLAGMLSTATISIGMVLSYFTAFEYFFVLGNVDGVYQTLIPFSVDWLRFSETLNIHMGIYLDAISVMMMVVVTTISTMVHIYSFGYMKGEEGFNRFFAFLSLFSFSMLGLVIATNIFQMYVFWELVGVSSFLLIGYYYQKPSAVSASKKAFIVTRFADFFFLVGILVLSYYTGTFDFVELTNPAGGAIGTFAGASFLGLGALTWALTLIFIGGAGKSAMFPLHIWLPDAMEGPTPVSALIHAATMVVAGVYLVARLFVLFVMGSPQALEIVMWVGAFSALFAALIAITQTDIKRVLAFSTMSQIGYMMLALGVSGYGGEEGLGYTASMFHLFTHAMFKALLFLGAGAIIHAVHSNDMRDMGNLRKHLPITHITFLIAALAISGIPIFSGFFSKDEILAAAFATNKIVFFMGWAVAGLTAFYMFRLYYSIFWNGDKEYAHPPHEAGWNMTGPLLFLAFMATFAGLIPFSEFVSPDGVGYHAHFHWNIAIPSVAIAAVGIWIATMMYKSRTEKPDGMTSKFPLFYRWSLHKFYIDEVYLFVTHKIIFKLIAWPTAWFDKKVVDGSFDGIAWVTNKVSDKIKGLQSGQLQQYAITMVLGVLAIILVLLYWMPK
jgi:NADH-quinone oxidoreductase subunit L